MNFRRSLGFLYLAVLAGSAPIFAQPIASDSPFAPRGNAVSAGPGATPGSHELVGVIATSKQTLVGITDKTTRKSLWIPVGRTVEGIEVLSCDPKQDQAVVRIGGETRTLVMQKGLTQTMPAPSTTTVAMPASPVRPQPGQPQPANATPTNPKLAEQEREARMLVSDLLEIGMQQRKAYEEAQKKAAQQKGVSAAPQPGQPPTAPAK
jgi:hypothetical protein